MPVKDDRRGDTKDVEAKIQALHDELATTLAAQGIDLPAPPEADRLGALFPTSVMDWTCSQLLETANGFFHQSQLAMSEEPPNTEQGNQYYQAGGAFWDAYRGQCP